MRLPWLVVLALASSCTATTAVTQRVAFTTIPGTPQALSGGSGAHLGVRMLTGSPTPQEQGGGVSVASFQPELGAVVRVADRTRANVKLAITSAGVARNPVAGAPAIPDWATSGDLVVGFGHDVPLSPKVGLALGAEVGVTAILFTAQVGPLVGSWEVLQPSIRGAFGIYGEPGPVRLFAAATLGTSTWNDATSVQTRDCAYFPCGTQDTGRLGLAAIVHAGGGLRWQARPGVALVAEGWMPVTSVATRLPFTASVSLVLGEFDARSNRAPRPPPAPTAMPPRAPAPVAPPTLSPDGTPSPQPVSPPL